MTAGTAPAAPPFPWLRWVALLYFAQGLPYGLASRAWPVYFRSHGVALADIGLMSLLFLPYTLKAAWAPLVDRFGNRRGWVAAALFTLGSLALALPLFDPARPTALLWTVLAAFTLASATQDLASDGFAVDVVAAPGGQRRAGPLNGLRVAAYRAALVAGGGLALVIAGALGWNALWVLAAVTLMALAGLALACPLPPRGPRRTAAATVPVVAAPARRRVRWTAGAAAAGCALLALRADPLWWVAVAIAATLVVASWLDDALLAWVGRREMRPVLAMAFLYKVADQGLNRMVEPFWVDRGASPAEIGLVSTTLGTVLVVAGALLGGLAVRRFGLFPALLAMGVVQALSNFGYGAVAAFDLPRSGLYIAALVEALTQGLSTAAFLAFLTALCDGDHGASQFALLSALFALSRDLVGAVSGRGVEALGYAGYFCATALLGLPALLLLPALRRQLAARETDRGGLGAETV